MVTWIFFAGYLPTDDTELFKLYKASFQFEDKGLYPVLENAAGIHGVDIGQMADMLVMMAGGRSKEEAEAAQDVARYLRGDQPVFLVQFSSEEGVVVPSP